MHLAQDLKDNFQFMRINQIINSLNQIYCAEHVSTIIGVSRHLNWILRRILKKFPVELDISSSKIIASKHSGVDALINCMGVYDYNNMNFIKLILKKYRKNGLFFDVGANIGSYALIASEVANAKVFAFEPNRKAFLALKKNIELNKRSNVKLFNFAVSDKESIILLTNEIELSTNQVVNEHDVIQKKVISVKSMTLDKICYEYNVRPSIVKIDVEGHELNVLEGFQDCIKDTDVLIIEKGDDYEIRNMLNLLGFQGPFYFHLNKYEISQTAQKRAEDPIFSRPGIFQELNKQNTIIRSKV